MFHTFRTGWIIAVQVRSASTDDGGKAGNELFLEQVILNQPGFRPSSNASTYFIVVLAFTAPLVHLPMA
jgi:hypothetical protein